MPSVTRSRRVVVEGHEHAVGGEVHVGLEVAEAEVDRGPERRARCSPARPRCRPGGRSPAGADGPGTGARHHGVRVPVAPADGRVVPVHDEPSRDARRAPRPPGLGPGRVRHRRGDPAGVPAGLAVDRDPRPSSATARPPAGLVLAAFFGASAVVSSRIGAGDRPRRTPAGADGRARRGRSCCRLLIGGVGAASGGARRCWPLRPASATPPRSCRPTCSSPATCRCSARASGFAVKQSAMPGASLRRRADAAGDRPDARLALGLRRSAPCSPAPLRWCARPAPPVARAAQSGRATPRRGRHARTRRRAGALGSLAVAAALLDRCGDHPRRLLRRVRDRRRDRARASPGLAFAVGQPDLDRGPARRSASRPTAARATCSASSRR